MLGWFRADAACASRWNRARACGSRATSTGRNLSATKRWRRVSSALYTTPIPPSPSFSVTRKCEMVWPIMEQAILRSAMLGAWKARVNGSGQQTAGIVQMTGHGYPYSGRLRHFGSRHHAKTPGWSANRKLSSDALYSAGLYEASERKTTDSGRTFTVPKPYIIEPSGLTSSEKQIPRNCWKH